MCWCTPTNRTPWCGKEDCRAPVPTGLVPRPKATEAVAQHQEQPAPTANQHPAVWPLVMVDMASRDKLGRERYGLPLQPHNGRDMLRDIYEELLDAAVYIRAAIYERDGK